MEITVTGANALTCPVLNIWNWVVSLYLFLIAAAAGLLVMTGLSVLLGRDSNPEQRRDILAAAGCVPLLILLGGMTIWLELGVRQNSHWLLFSFSFSSTMFWGVWGLLLTFIESIFFSISLMSEAPMGRLKFEILKKLFLRLASCRRPLAVIGCILGILAGAYAGLSLSSLVARPLWNSAMAPLLFLASSMATGAALFVILSGKKGLQLFYTKALSCLLTAEIITLMLFFHGLLNSYPVKRQAVLELLSSEQTYILLILFFVLVGICIPLALILNLLRLDEEGGERISRAAFLRMKLSACLVLAGGVFLKLGWVYLGQLVKLS